MDQSTICAEGAKATTEAATTEAATVSVAPVEMRQLETKLTVSSELVPFREIEVTQNNPAIYRSFWWITNSREAGAANGSPGDSGAAGVSGSTSGRNQSAFDQVTRSQNDLHSVEAPARVSHLIYERLNRIAQIKPGLVAQQEVDDAQGKDLAL